MLQSISWGQYIMTIAVALAGYYLYVGYKYFRWEILALIGVQKVDENSISISLPDKRQLPKEERHEDYLPKSILEVDISPLIQAFTDEAEAYISVADVNAPKPELLYSLQQIASKYKALKEADCKTELLQFVWKTARRKYPGLLEQEDIKQLWL